MSQFLRCSYRDVKTHSVRHRTPLSPGGKTFSFVMTFFCLCHQPVHGEDRHPGDDAHQPHQGPEPARDHQLLDGGLRYGVKFRTIRGQRTEDRGQRTEDRPFGQNYIVN